MKTRSPRRLMRHECVCLVFALGLAVQVTAGVSAETRLTGRLGSKTELIAADSPYVASENIEVPVGGTLVIHPGVEIRFRRVSLIVRGTLIARGTEDKPILLTSSQPQPARGDWLFLQFEPTSVPGRVRDGQYLGGSVLEHTIVEYGHGLLLNNASPYIGWSTIRDNRKKSGGGIYAVGGAPLICHSVIEHNHSERHGGGIRTAHGSPTIIGCTIRFNTARYSGGGICTDFSGSHIERNTIAHNSASSGGGISTGKPQLGEGFVSGRAHSRPIMIGNVIEHNTAAGAGGGIEVDGSPRIEGNRIFNNRLRATAASDRDHDKAMTDSTDRRKQVGAGISIQGGYGGRAIVKGNAIVGNRDARWGGGLFCDRCSATIEDNYFAHNSATQFGGAISIFSRNDHRGGPSFPVGKGFDVKGNLFRNHAGGTIEITGFGDQRVTVTRCRFELGENEFAVLNHSTNPVPTKQLMCNQTRELPLYDYFDDQRLGKVLWDAAPEPFVLTTADRLAADTPAVTSQAPGTLRGAQSFFQRAGAPTATVMTVWQPSEHALVAGYRVYVWNLTRTYKERMPAGTATSRSPFEAGRSSRLKIDGLPPNTAYEIVVVGYDSEGRETGASNSVIVNVKDPR